MKIRHVANTARPWHENCEGDMNFGLRGMRSNWSYDQDLNAIIGSVSFSANVDSQGTNTVDDEGLNRPREEPMCKYLGMSTQTILFPMPAYTCPHYCCLQHRGTSDSGTGEHTDDHVAARRTSRQSGVVGTSKTKRS